MEVMVTFSSLPLSRRAGFAVLAMLLSSAAMAQVPDQQTTPLAGPKTRQPKPSSIQQSENPQETEDKRQSEAERRMREADRKLNRAMRSICSGC
jgi:hypothetical protein